MKVIFLGTGEAFDERYPNHSHLVLFDKTALMLDCGDSAVRQLWKYTKDHSLIDVLYITHRHSDHLFGIPALLGRMLEEERKKELTIICSEQIKADVERLTEHAYFGINSYGFEIKFIIAEDGKEIQFNDLKLTFAKTLHTAYNLAVRIDDGKKIVCYSGDGPFDEATEKIYKTADILMHECYMFDKRIKGHVAAVDVFEMAKRNNVKCLALAHFKRVFNDETRKRVKKEIPTIGLKIIIPEPLEEYNL
ncbi:MAG: ribonuclease Z [Patescibacteria group bacterium]